MMDPFGKYKSEEIEVIANEEENKKCFQCLTSPANWICVYNGIFLCASCAGEHRGFGNRISCIKSLILDKLNPFQIEMMKIGGNTKAKTLLMTHWKDYKEYERIVVFSSKLMDYHRNVLYDTIVGNPIQPLVTANEVTEIMEKTNLVQRPILTDIPPKIEQKVELKEEEEEEQEPPHEENEQPEEEGDVKEENKVNEDQEKANVKEQQKEEDNKPTDIKENDISEEEKETLSKAKEEAEKKRKEEDDKIVITKEVSDEPFLKPELPVRDSSQKGKYQVAKGKTKETSDCALQ